MNTPSNVKDRYDRTAILGQGGMGVVYRAYDRELRRDVALKTILDSSDPAGLDLFRRECAVLASLNHPNVIDIYDIGELEEDGQRRPYFVMPLLEGSTLDALIRDSPQRLSVDRTIEIITQACRGLQAAHEHGLIHRDLKPSNLFVLKDDSVKIIDFGVASLTGATTAGGARGTLLYMAPEQVQHKAANAQSDIYALGVTCFEALTRRHPFSGCPTEDLARAILQDAAPAASELNPAVSPSLSQVIHAAMAKQPFRRYATAREFSETLQKGLHNQPIERFDPERLLPRIARAEKAFEDSEFDFAGEILAEIEAEGHLHPTIRPLARRIDQALRGKTVSQLFEAARRRYAEDEFALALQKLQEVMQIEPGHADAAALKLEIESKRGAQQIENWFQLARQHIDNGAFGPARQALQNVVQLTPSHSTAIKLLADIDRRENDYLRARQQKEEVYEEALDFWRKGEVTAAVARLEKVLDLDRKAPDTIAPERSAAYQDLYNEVCSESNTIKAAYDEARRHIANGTLTAATEICDKWLAKYPGNALFQALIFDIDGARRQQLSTDIARTDGELEKEFDLDSRVRIIEAAAAKHPGEGHFEKLLKAATAKRDIAYGIVTKARALEERGAYEDALTQWEILRSVSNQYPGIDVECDRVRKRREQKVRAEIKANWIAQIDEVLDKGDSTKGLALVREAMLEFPDDPELKPLEQLARQRISRAEEAGRLLAKGLELTRQNQLAEGLDCLRHACGLDQNNLAVRTALLDVLVTQASLELDRDWTVAQELVREASAIDSANPRLRSLGSLLGDRRREAVVSQHLSRARAFQVSRDLEHALAEVEQGLFAYPEEPRLVQLKGTLTRACEDTLRGRQPGTTIRGAERGVDTPSDQATLDGLLERAQKIAQVSGPPRSPVAAVPPQVSSRQPTPSDLAPTLSILHVPGVTNQEPPAPSPPPSAPSTEAAAPKPPATKTAPAVKGSAKPNAPRAKPNAPPATATPVASSAAPPNQPIPPVRRKSSPLSDWRWIAAAAIVMIASAWIFTRIRTHPADTPATPRATEVRVPLQISPDTARVFFKGEDLGPVRELKLPEGSHEIKIFLDGYQPQTVTAEVNGKGATIAPVALQPLTAFLKLDMSAGRAELNKEPVSNKSGVFRQDLPPGEYSLKLIQPSGTATIDFRVATGAMPEVTDVKVSNMTVNAVAILGKRVRVYGPGASNFLEIPDLAPGPQVITIGESGATKLQVEMGPSPSLQVVVTDPEMVKLAVNANEDGANVLVDGVPAGVIRNGQFLIVRKPGAYAISVEKPGFTGPPPEKVRLEIGKSQRLKSFQLVRNAALLTVTGAPDAQVLVDGVEKGLVPATGVLELSVEPGRRKISLKKDGFESIESEQEFRAGDKITRSGQEMLRPLAKLALALTPKGARSVATRKGGGAPVALQEGANNLQPGDYDITSRSPGFNTDTRTITLRRGETLPLAITLSASGAISKGPDSAPVISTAGVKDLSGVWEQKDGWFNFAQDAYSLLPVNPNGTATFTVQRKKPGGIRIFGKEKASWVAFYIDTKNHVLFELDAGQLTVYEVLQGSKKQRGKVAVDKDSEDVKIQLSVDQAVVDIGAAHLAATPDKRLHGGKFGFKGPAGVKDFRYQGAR